MDSENCWEAACGGLETPFQYRGKTYLYMWNRMTGQHAHYCQTDDVFLNKEEWVSLVNGSN